MEVPVYREGERPLRAYAIQRKTKETDIQLSLSLEGGEVSVSTGIGFFDHMLTAFAFYGGLGLKLEVYGDLEVDGHHTVEDVGIVLGQAMSRALGDRKGIRRFASAYIPMDEALCFTALDFSNRPFLVFDADMPQPMIGAYDACLTEEFMRAFAVNSGLTLHMKCLYGKNAHHITEALFKSLGVAVKEAVAITGTGVTSTKGVL
ncbi:imidazoleglycerol-phosphate dehydratase HisB [Intestinimonas timonensis]|uniref:imidazoleglycerol-phosphate dehydratase HisB n=1 Tax=Intestinimonas timonensis TaxID=1689270 RepID=UPI0023F12BDC|nr:imidazoleglycerol-phosphate dehydratase HisB [Intestinimonas timonensis]